MEFLLELLFDIIVEGSIELGSSKKVPMPLRILAFCIVFLIFGGFGGLMLYMAYDAYTTSIVGAILCGIIGIGMILGGIGVGYKMFCKKREKEKDMW